MVQKTCMAKKPNHLHTNNNIMPLRTATAKGDTMNFVIIDKNRQTEILGENPKRLAWGYFYPARATGAVGARMIYERGYLSVLADRVAVSGASEQGDKKAREQAAKIIGQLERFLKKYGISPSDDDIIFAVDNKARLLATPNRSYGYLYMSYWLEN